MWPFRKRVYRDGFKSLIWVSLNSGLSENESAGYGKIIEDLLPDLNKDELKYIISREYTYCRQDAIRLLLNFDSKEA